MKRLLAAIGVLLFGATALVSSHAAAAPSVAVPAVRAYSNNPATASIWITPIVNCYGSSGGWQISMYLSTNLQPPNNSHALWWVNPPYKSLWTSGGVATTIDTGSSFFAWQPMTASQGSRLEIVSVTLHQDGWGNKARTTSRNILKPTWC